jgi:hypothetical protein
MALSGIFCQVGNLLLLAALALLLALNATAPTFTHLGLFTVKNDFPLYNESSPILSYGSLGYCVQVVPES